jgi:diadenosine tetraphosphatase ApaH/serine/threonine PP2A family protein phosphatase
MRIAVLSDIHSNLLALDAVLADIGSIDAVWHLGDVVGYGPEPDAVVERLAGVGAVGVRGNHDSAAVGGHEIDWFNPDARAAIEWTMGQISERTVDWLRALPETRREGDFTLVHGSPREPLWEYITSTPVARANLAELETPFGLHGHTHVPIVFAQRDGRMELIAPSRGSTFALDAGNRPAGAALVNPGSVGQPRDGDPTASYLVLDTAAGTCTWQRVGYDVGKVQAAIRAAGLPGRLADRLSYGI